jgi:hypothetical protein
MRACQHGAQRLGPRNAVARKRPFHFKSSALTMDLAPAEISACGRLLLDVLNGDPTLSIRDGEAEES